MSIFSKIQSKDRLFVAATLLCLFLTTFPLAQGWIGTGDFLPRALFLIFVLFLKPKLFSISDISLLFVFFAYSIIMTPDNTIIVWAANFMELLLPLVMANFFLDPNNKNSALLLGKITIFISVFIMLNTILVDSVHKDIVRQMVAFSAYGELDKSKFYLRLGVCIYSFAMISMCLAPALLFCVHNTKHKIVYSFFLIITIYFVYITGITTCLLILILMVLLYLFVIKRRIKMFFPITVLTLFIGYMFGFVIVEFLLPYFEDTNFYGHLAGLMEFYGKTTMVQDTYDVEGRVELYRYSIDTFFKNPLLGSSAGKIGGHNFFLDHFARLGILGMTPFIIFIILRFKAAFKVLSTQAQIVYMICILGFIALGFLKGMNGIDFWTYMFVYIPCILKYADTLNSKKHRVA